VTGGTFLHKSQQDDLEALVHATGMCLFEKCAGGWAVKPSAICYLSSEDQEATIRLFAFGRSRCEMKAYQVYLFEVQRFEAALLRVLTKLFDALTN
jgi:hypothetical protein